MLIKKSIVFVILIQETLFASAYSTVSPHIQAAQMSIDMLVNQKMQQIQQHIKEINNNADQNFVPGYKKKKTNLDDIKDIQARKLLILKEIKLELNKNVDLSQNTNTQLSIINNSLINNIEESIIGGNSADK